MSKGANNYPIYECQKFGVTIEFDKKYANAESAFVAAHPGGVALYKLDVSTGKKYLLKTR